jgi:hypothetical protein
MLSTTRSGCFGKLVDRSVREDLRLLFALRKVANTSNGRVFIVRNYNWIGRRACLPPKSSVLATCEIVQVMARSRRRVLLCLNDVRNVGVFIAAAFKVRAVRTCNRPSGGSDHAGGIGSNNAVFA